MCEAARAAAVRASVLDTAAAAARLAAQQMRSDNQRMLDAARTGLQKIKNASWRCLSNSSLTARSRSHPGSLLSAGAVRCPPRPDHEGRL